MKRFCLFLMFGLVVVHGAYADIATALATFGTSNMISNAVRVQKREMVNDEVLMMVTGVRSLFGEYDDFSYLDNSTIFSAIGMSNENPYGGVYDLMVNPEDSKQFIVSIGGLTQSDCEYFVTRKWSDSVEYIASNGKKGGATGDCNKPDGENMIKITYGE